MTDFIRFLLQSAGRRGPFVVLLQLLGSLTEGISILLLIPILSVVNRSSTGEFMLTIPKEIWFGPLQGKEISLFAVLIGLIVMVILQAAMTVFRNHYVANTMLGIMNSFRLSILASIVNSNWRYYASHHNADLNHMLTGDIDRVNAVAVSVMNLMQMSLMFSVYFVLSMFISPPMTMFACAVGLVMFILLRPVRKGAARHGANLTGNRQQQYRMVADFLDGMKITKTFNVEHFFVDRIRDTLERQKQDSLGLNRLSSRVSAVYQVLSTIALAVFVYVALIYQSLTLPELVVMLLLFMRVAPRLMSFQATIQLAISNMPAFAAMQKLKTEFDKQREIDFTTEGDSLPLFESWIELADVCYEHPSDEKGRAVLHSINMVIEPGKVTALIGPSGSGKSTIADILLGLLRPTKGHLMIDRKALSPSQLRAWRKQVAFVPQDDFLMHDTIATNMRLAKLDASDEEIWQALTQAQASGFVKKLPNQINEMIGDRGRRLSGGERQRISLARALLRKPQLLVLDEATSALDWQSQKQIAHVIDNLRGHMTVLTIAHRPSMIAFADHVFALDQGRMVEAGSFKALSSDPSSKLYAMLRGENAVSSVE